MAAKTTDEEHIIMGCATYRLLDSMFYVQAFQYEPPIYKTDTRTTERERVIFITTDDNEDVPLAEKTYDEAQHDATYLAVYFAYLPAELQECIDFDTSNGRQLIDRDGTNARVA